jgi:hypothetical protein
VQTDDFFSGELIPHSRRVSLDAIEGQAAGAAKNAEIVTCCGGPQCRDAGPSSAASRDVRRQMAIDLDSHSVDSAPSSGTHVDANCCIQ